MGRDILSQGIHVIQYSQMATTKRTRFQIDASTEIRDQAKEVASHRRQTLTEFVLKALAKEGDPELTKLIEKELAEKQPPGRPQN
jgi:uncharacterized protein (DUF1778 family)